MLFLPWVVTFAFSEEHCSRVSFTETSPWNPGRKERKGGRERRELERYGEQRQGNCCFTEATSLSWCTSYNIALLGGENHKIDLCTLEITLKLKTYQDQPGCWKERGHSFNSSLIDAAKCARAPAELGLRCKGMGWLWELNTTWGQRGLQVWVTLAWAVKDEQIWSRWALWRGCRDRLVRGTMAWGHGVNTRVERLLQ